MTKLVIKFLTGGSYGSNTSTGSSVLNGAMLGFAQSGAYGMIAQGFGGFTNKFPTPNADLNSNNLMAALARDGISNALLMSGNPWAMAAGATVKVLDKTGGFTDVSEGLGDGNDIGNAIMSFALPGAGYFMPKTDEYKMSADMKVMSRGYAGSVKDAGTAESNSGAKLWFGRNKANRMIAEALRKDDLISDIKRDSDADFQTARSMTQNKAYGNQYALMGGYHQAYARVGKFGLKLLRAQQLAIKFKEPSEIKEQKEVYVMKDGGEFFANLRREFIPTTEELNNAFFSSLLTEEDIQKFQKGGKPKKKDRELSELIEYAKKQNPRFVLRMSEPLKDIEFTDVHGNVSRGTHYMADDPDGIVYPTIQEMEDGSLKYFENRDEARERAIKNNNYLLFETSNEANNFARNYKQGWPDFFGLKQIDGKWYKSDGEDENGKRYLDQEGGLYYFKEGGQMNVIPEGSLHARLHHMENADNLTKKGIPVVDNEGNQLAEIEHSEIIFTKEVTEKLEELYKKFKSDEYTNKEKEGFAIEAGKLLSKEIIENTDDRVGLLNDNGDETLANN